LDEYLTNTVIYQYTKGKRRAPNPKYDQIMLSRYRRTASEEEKNKALKEMRKVPRMNMHDPNFRRSLYIRYGYEFLYLFAGPLSEAKDIGDKIK